MRSFQAWYFLYFGSQACLQPFLALYYRRLGLGEDRIGLLVALQPWIEAPGGLLWGTLADRTRRHRQILAFTFVASTVTRLSQWVGRQYEVLVALVVTAASMSGPVMVISDAAVSAACEQAR